MTDPAGSEAWSYDSMGRVLADQRTTNGVTLTFPYTYNLDGSVASVNYPWGELVSFTPGGAGRPLTESGVSIFGTTNYVTAAHYTPGGALCSLSSALNNAVSNYTFNSRLQPQHYHITPIPWGGNGAPTPCSSPTWTAGWLDQVYNYVDSSGHNNGNLVSVLDNTDWAKSQSFSYDSLNRLATAQSYGQNASNHYQCWAETYTYDPWGNLYQFAANTTTQSAYIGCSQESGLNSTANTKNQLTSYNYDAAGNLISIPSVATYTYNAENQLTSTGGVTYTYDGDGKRVMKSSGTLYWYGLNSGPLMETTLTGTANFLYFFFNGQIINRREFGHGNILDNYIIDRLGNTSIVSGYSGAWDQSYYYPFGGERIYYSNVGNHYKFTGKERDPESGLDNFGARFNASSMGRFMSPDPRFFQAMMLVDPQRFNLYTYGGNNPLKWIDPSGENLWLSGDLWWLLHNVLYSLAGGEEAFNDYFHVEDGQVVLNEGVEREDLDNSGQDLIYDLVSSSDNYVYFAGTSGSDAAALFTGNYKNGKLNGRGKEVANEFTCGGGRTGGCGTLVGTSGRPGALQPASLSNGDPVFAVIAYNVGAVETQVGIDYGQVSPVVDEVRTAEAAGLNQAIQPVSLFIHESRENLAFRENGNFNYPAAHDVALLTEARIRRELHIGGGFAGGLVKTTVPRQH